MDYENGNNIGANVKDAEPMKVEKKNRGSWWGSFFKILFGFVLGVAITESVFIYKLNNMVPKVTIVEKESAQEPNTQSSIEKQDDDKSKEESISLSDIAERVLKETMKQLGKEMVEKK